MNLYGESNRKIAIRIIQNETNKIIHNCTLNVYTDEQCKNLVKSIEIQEGQAENKGYSYESDDILENGVYYIRVENAPDDCIINPGIFKFEISDKKNVLQICMEKFVTNYGGEKTIEAYGDKIYLNDTINVSFEDAYLSQDVTIWLEPIAEYDITKCRYVPFEKFAEVEGIKYIDNSYMSIMKMKEISETTYAIMEKNNYQYSISVSGNPSTGIETTLSAKYAYIIKVEDISNEADIISCPPKILFPTIESGRYLEKQYLVGLTHETEARYSNMRIITNIGNNYDTTKKPITFVYRIKQTDEQGKIVYSDIAMVNVENNGNVETVLENLRADLEATVTLEYCSQGFATSNGNEKKVIVKLDGTSSVNFDFTTLNTDIKTGAMEISEFSEAKDEVGRSELLWEKSNHYTDGKIGIVGDVINWAYYIGVENIADIDDAAYYVRVKTFISQGVNTTTLFEDENAWEKREDGYWYYKVPLHLPEETSKLLIKLNKNDALEPGSEYVYHIGIIAEYVNANGNRVSGWIYE